MAVEMEVSVALYSACSLALVQDITFGSCSHCINLQNPSPQ